MIKCLVLFIHSSIQQIILECLLCAKLCFRYWGYSHEQNNVPALMMLIFYQGRGKIARKEKDRGEKASISDGDTKAMEKINKAGLRRSVRWQRELVAK